MEIRNKESFYYEIGVMAFNAYKAENDDIDCGMDKYDVGGRFVGIVNAIGGIDSEKLQDGFLSEAVNCATDENKAKLWFNKFVKSNDLKFEIEITKIKDEEKFYSEMGAIALNAYMSETDDIDCGVDNYDLCGNFVGLMNAVGDISLDKLKEIILIEASSCSINDKDVSEWLNNLMESGAF